MPYNGNPVPIQAPNFREEDLKAENGYGYLNQWATQVTLAANLANGAVGPTVLPKGLDTQGGRITGIPAPEHPSDAISSGHAQTQFSAPSLQPQLDIGGKNTLKGLSYLYGWQQQNQAAIQNAITLTPTPYTGVSNFFEIAGFIIQFGNIANMDTAVFPMSFPEPFPNACISIVASTTGPTDRITYITSFSSTQFTFANNGTGAGATWIAVGW